jgi:hypothetical protein
MKVSKHDAREALDRLDARSRNLDMIRFVQQADEEYEGVREGGNYHQVGAYDQQQEEYRSEDDEYIASFDVRGANDDNFVKFESESDRDGNYRHYFLQVAHLHVRCRSWP